MFISRGQKSCVLCIAKYYVQVKKVLVDYAVNRFTETNRERHLAAYFVNIDTYRYQVLYGTSCYSTQLFAKHVHTEC